MRQRRLLPLSLTCLAALTLVLAGATAVGAHDWDNPHPGAPTEPVPAEASKDLSRIATTRSVGSVNTDLAFWGTTAYMGVYHALQIVDIANPAKPTVLSQFPCHGSQNDVSVWNGLLFMSIDRPQTKPECDSANTTGNGPGWEGIRIFNVADPAHPVHVGSVATDCGSHTHTLVPDPGNGRVLLYIASYSSSPDTFGLTPWGNNCQVDHGYISVVEVPTANPAAAKVVSKPRLPLDAYFQSGGNGCHDIGVFTELKMAAAACSGNALILDISDPARPVATDWIGLPHNKAFWHSGAFSNDGKVAVFGDETYGGVGNACRNNDVEGRLWFFRVDPVSKQFVSHTAASSYKIPRQADGGFNASCTAHNYNVLPIPGKNILNSAWYTGGTTLVDFTDPADPKELAYFDYKNVKFYGGAWSSYYYNGYSYATSIDTGLEVLDYTGTADAGAIPQPYLNAQTQEQALPSGTVSSTVIAASAMLWQATVAGPQPWRTGHECCCGGGSCGN
ncbi:MAG TPA: hypothetical protein DGT23_28690 [Micromonosporaceae bacterium]|nr:hypothetical protein [Micromonosporaceae bacterium]